MTQDMTAVLARLKWLAKAAAPEARSAHRSEAIAAALGFGSNAALLSAWADPAARVTSLFDHRMFSLRLQALGSAAPDADALDVMWTTAQAALRTSGAGPRLTEFRDGSLHRRREQRVALERRLLLARGVEPSPDIDHWGGIPGSLEWSFSWLPDADLVGGAALISLRLHAPRNSLRSAGPSLGWGAPHPDRGVTVRANAVLEFLAGGWLQETLKPFSGRPAWFNPDLRGTMRPRPGHATGNRAGDADLVSALPYLGIDYDEEGIHVDDGARRFSPGSETILVVEALTLLGDAIREGMVARSRHPLDLAMCSAWRDQRRTDGLRPLAQHRHEGDADPALECRTASWLASRIGLDPSDYKRAITWEAASEVIDGRGMPGGVELLPMDGFRALALGLLPSGEAVRRMAEAAADASPGIGVDDWIARVVADRNSDKHALAYYAHWAERRSWCMGDLTDVAERADILRTRTGLSAPTPS